MKNFRVFVFLALSVAAVGVAYADTGKCSNTISHVEQRSCLEAQFREAEKRLALTEQRTMAEIAAWDEDTGYRSASRKALLASNRAFRKYRANQCEYEWTLAAGGEWRHGYATFLCHRPDTKPYQAAGGFGCGTSEALTANTGQKLKT